VRAGAANDDTANAASTHLDGPNGRPLFQPPNDQGSEPTGGMTVMFPDEYMFFRTNDVAQPDQPDPRRTKYHRGNLREWYITNGKAAELEEALRIIDANGLTEDWTVYAGLFTRAVIGGPGRGAATDDNEEKPPSTRQINPLLSKRSLPPSNDEEENSAPTVCSKHGKENLPASLGEALATNEDNPKNNERVFFTSPYL
jgi:hypothetical protein